MNGKLEIQNGDTIEADYLDSLGIERTATALADLAPPVTSGVNASDDLGVITITWQTSEPANSIVRYSTNLTFNLAVTNSGPRHQLIPSGLTGLIPGETYYFYVGLDRCRRECHHQRQLRRLLQLRRRRHRRRSCWWMPTTR